MAESRPGLRLWDRLVLLVAWGATCGIVFLLGLSVGRGTNPQTPGSDDRIVRLPVNTPAPPAVAPVAAPGEDVTFYERLVAADRTQGRMPPPVPGHDGIVAPSTIPPKTKALPPAAAAGAAQAAAAAKAVGAVLAAVPKATPPPPKAVPPTLANVVAVAAPVVPKVSASAPSPKIAIASAKTPSPAPAAVAAAPTPPPPAKNWTVTINPTADRYEAEALMHQLKAKGYAAAMVQTAKGTGKQYRVRIGQYGSSTEAATAAKKLQKDGLQGAVPASTE